MKRLVIALGLCLLMLGLIAVPAVAAAQKVPLHAIGTDPGDGFVVVNDTSGPNNVQIEMSIKGAQSNATYDVIVHISWGVTIDGTVTTNARGNANFHCSTSVSPGDHVLVLRLEREGEVQFRTHSVHHSF